jgi:hypothetical protein
MSKLFEKLILKTIHRHVEERNLLNASQFGFRAHHSTTLQCIRLTDHVSLDFNKNMSTAAVFLDIEKAFGTTWHPGLLYKLSELQFPISLIKLIASFLTNRKFEASVEGEISSPRKVAAGVPQGSVLAPLLYSLYIYDAPAAPGTQLQIYWMLSLFYNSTSNYGIFQVFQSAISLHTRCLATIFNNGNIIYSFCEQYFWLR